MGAIDRHGSTAAPMPATAAQTATTPPNTLRRPANGLLHLFCELVAAGGGGDEGCAEICSLPRNPFRIRSGVNGGSRKRTPVASYIAFAIAAALGTEADSPTPKGT